MLAIELHAVGAAVLVDLEAVRELRAHAGAQLRILRGAADVTEGDGIDGRSALSPGSPAHRQLEMPAADDACVEAPELAVKNRFGKSLTPGSRAAQHPGRIDAKLRAGEFAVGVNDAAQRFDIGARGAFPGARSSELIEPSLRQAHARGHGVAAEFVDEPRMTGGDAVERISNVDAGDGARRPAQSAILGPRKNEQRTK